MLRPSFRNPFDVCRVERKMSSIRALITTVVTIMMSSTSIAEERPILERDQNSKRNLSIIILRGTEMGSGIVVDQIGKRNTSITAQGLRITGTFQFSSEDIPLNKAFVTQHGEESSSSTYQKGINNDAVVIQTGEPMTGQDFAKHDHRYEIEQNEEGGFRMLLQSGEVDMDIYYELSGYKASSSFGRSH